MALNSLLVLMCH